MNDQIQSGIAEHAGAVCIDGGVNFALYSAGASAVELCLFDDDRNEDVVAVETLEPDVEQVESLLRVVRDEGRPWRRQRTEAVEDLLSGVSPGDSSGRFHNTVAKVTVQVAEALLAELGQLPVALTGGVFQNAHLVGKIEQKLPNEIRVLRHREVPPGDGGIALGQALIADAFLGDKG